MTTKNRPLIDRVHASIPVQELARMLIENAGVDVWGEGPFLIEELYIDAGRASFVVVRQRPKRRKPVSRRKPSASKGRVKR